MRKVGSKAIFSLKTGKLVRKNRKAKTKIASVLAAKESVVLETRREEKIFR